MKDSIQQPSTAGSTNAQQIIEGEVEALDQNSKLERTEISAEEAWRAIEALSNSGAMQQRTIDAKELFGKHIERRVGPVIITSRLFTIELMQKNLERATTLGESAKDDFIKITAIQASTACAKALASLYDQAIRDAKAVGEERGAGGRLKGFNLPPGRDIPLTVYQADKIQVNQTVAKSGEGDEESSNVGG